MLGVLMRTLILAALLAAAPAFAQQPDPKDALIATLRTERSALLDQVRQWQAKATEAQAKAASCGQ